MSEDEPYESLRKALNRFPLRTPKSKKFLKLLKMLYSEEEAKILSKFGLPYIYYEGILESMNKQDWVGFGENFDLLGKTLEELRGNTIE